MADTGKRTGRPTGSKNKTAAAKKTTGKRTSSGKRTGKGAVNAGTGNRVKDEIWAVIIIAVGIFFALSIQTKAAGELGLVIKNFFLGCFGQVAVVLPYYLILYGALLFLKKTAHMNKRSAVLLVVTFLMFSIIYSGSYVEPEKISFSYINLSAWFTQGIKLANGGALGMLLAVLVMVAVGTTGLYIFAGLVILVCVMLLINTPISQFIEDYKLRKSVKREMEQEAAAAEAAAAEERQRQLELELKNNYKGKKKSGIIGAGDIEPMIKNAKETEKKKNILGYMKNDKNFGLSKEETKEAKGNHVEPKAAAEPEKATEHEVKISYGLEESAEVKAGFGLCDDIEPAFAETQTVTAPPVEEAVQKTVTKTVQTPVNVQGFEAAAQVQAEAEKAAELSRDKFVKSNEVHKVQGLPTEGIQEQMKIARKEAVSAVLSPDDFSKTAEAMERYEFPSIDFLNKNKTNRNNAELEVNLKAKAAKLEKTLQDFKVDARVVQVTQGPAVTRYEIQPNTGVKVSSIVRLSDDIALNLEARSIRIEAPIPGKAAVGIEVENEKINMVTLREIVDSKEFKESASKITFAVGKDIAGKSIVADLKSMPHLLIAGSTGSGKSVCINSIIISILYKAKPDEVKFVLIDPKVVELGNYNGIPHMLIPVVTEPSKAAAALNWAVAEMTDRYKKFAEEGVRDLAGFNDLMKSKGEVGRVMPQIVIIIDELADLMMAAPSQVEESICRLAQMARAAGMHLIVATQRPSVDIITGVIKANIPSRIAFAVSSQFDSRTILDMGGAEKLVGKGDMLFNPLGTGKPLRVQGNFISDKEVHDVIEHLKQQCVEAEYSADVVNTIENANNKPEVSDDGDEFLAEAIEAVVRAEQASVSMLQRRFRIGYNRAARIVDMMEARGIVGPQDGSRPRQVLMTLDELLGIQSEHGESEAEAETEIDEIEKEG